MKKIFLFCITLVAFIDVSIAQDLTVMKKIYDSLLIALKNNIKEDSNRVEILANLGNNSADNDSTVLLLQQAIGLAQKIKFSKGEANARDFLGNFYWNVNNYTGALQQYMLALKIAEQSNNKKFINAIYGNIANTYLSLGNVGKALEYAMKSFAIDKERQLTDSNGFDLSTAAKAYMQLNMPDSALYFANRAMYYSTKSKNEVYEANALQAIGDIYIKMNEATQALQYYQQGIPKSEKAGFPLATSEMMAAIARIYYKAGQKDSAIYYSKQSLEIARTSNAITVVAEDATLLYKIYKSSDERQSMKYLEMAGAAKDSIFNNQKNNELQSIAYNEEAIQKDKEAAEFQYKTNLKFYGSIALAVIIGIIALIQLRNNSQKRKANLLLERQKQKIENTLSELKSTQAQLIQSEKMASLGELTAGIAHEIQNPLNFVNNFSEVNKEILEELKAERLKPNVKRDDDLQNELINDVIANEEKINHHGKRADAIVKGMLQHSRPTTGTSEPTDVNALADEYLRLAYHGMRAKDKDFNAEMKTDFDSSIGKINIIPQDIGRVLLNLYNNAFYAIDEKKKVEGVGYEPRISVTTRKSGNQVFINVSDNGNGIPQKIVDKIFQPFFTTKPTGQGTGLGLSLSYDIVKAHGGEIKVETKEGEGTTFIIQLPV